MTVPTVFQAQSGTVILIDQRLGDDNILSLSFAERLFPCGAGVQVGQGRPEQLQDQLDLLPQVTSQLLAAGGISVLL